MSFGGLVLTNEGKNKMAAAISEKSALQFTGIQLGDESYDGSYVEKTKLSHMVMELPITSIQRKDNEVIIECDWNSQMAPKSFYLREIGIIGNDVLCYYDNTGDGNAEFIDPGSGVISKQKRFRFTISVTGEVEVTTMIQSELYALKEETEAEIQELREETKENLGKKLDKTGDASNATVEFKQASKRENISAGEKLSDFFGKITKWFADLKTVAFTGSYNDLSNKPTIPAAVEIKGNAETTYHTGKVNITPENIGLDNTKDINKPVSTAQQAAIDAAYANATAFTLEKISELVNGAPETLDTLKEVADAIAEHKSVTDALDAAIGRKANQSEVETWNNKLTDLSEKFTSYLPLEGSSMFELTNGSVSYKFHVINSGQLRISKTTSYYEKILAETEGNGFSESQFIAGKAKELTTARTIFGKSFDGSGNVDGQGLFYGEPTDTPAERFVNCGLQIRENGLVGGIPDIKYAPSIGFHWNNRVASMLCMNPNGNFIFYRADGVSGAGINTGNIEPLESATYTLGTSNHRWREIWCSTSLNTSSDRNLKKDIRDLADDDRYIKFFMKLHSKSYLFIDGESGRTHVGFISQDVEEAMKECGLSDLEFAGFCKDQKKKRVSKMKEIVHPANEETGEEEWTEEIEVDFDEELVFDEDGNPVYEYSLRYEEFIALNTMMIQKSYEKMSGMEERLRKLEEKIGI